jgi:hypothetical protein
MTCLKGWLIFGGIVLILGCLVSGGVLCWQSTKQSTCQDWIYQSPYNPSQSCGYTNTDLIAQSKCNSLCYCVDYKYTYTCINSLPGGVSPGFIAGGIVFIIVGIALIVCLGIYLCV